MSRIVIVSAIAVAVACVFVAGVTAEGSGPSLKKVHLVDHNPETGNFLFRGDMPCNDTAFNIDDLLAFMRQRAEEAGTPLPADFYLVDLSLNNVFDFNKYEREFWEDKNHASIGELINWPMGLAGVLPPSAYNESTAREMALSEVWKFDQLPTRIATVQQMINTKYEQPRAIYVHCTAGCDRTGEFIGAYRMSWQNANVTEMYALDTSECGRSPNWYGTNGLSWYCIYYEETNGTNIGNCEGFASCDPFGKCKPTAANSEEESVLRGAWAAAFGVVDTEAGLPGLPPKAAPESLLRMAMETARRHAGDNKFFAVERLNAVMAAIREGL